MAILHVKSPNGTTYNMTIVTSGTTESISEHGWCKLPNGLLIQWGHSTIITHPGGPEGNVYGNIIEYPTRCTAITASTTDAFSFDSNSCAIYGASPVGVDKFNVVYWRSGSGSTVTLFVMSLGY